MNEKLPEIWADGLWYDLPESFSLGQADNWDVKGPKPDRYTVDRDRQKNNASAWP